MSISDRILDAVILIMDIAEWMIRAVFGVLWLWGLWCMLVKLGSR